MNRLVAIGAAVGFVMAGAAARPSAGGTVDAPAVAGEDARTILMESDRRHRAESEEYLGEVTVTSRTGKTRRKEWRSYRAGPAGNSDRLIRFLSPPDVRGVGYLAHQRRGKETEAWLYLPSMKRERRIGARDREAAFVGTNFNYEDLDLLEFDDARYDTSLLAPQTVDGVAVYVVELTPRVRSIYTKKILTIRQDNFSLLSAEFFAGTGLTPVKRLTFASYTPVDGYLIAERLEIADLRKGGHTVVVLHDVVLNRPQPRDRYTIQNLLREDDDRARVSLRPEPERMSWSSRSPSPPELAPVSWKAGFSGYVETQSFAYLGGSGTHDSAFWQWVTAFVRQTARIGPLTIAGAVRFEDSSAGQVGPLVFDPADRNPRRSPVSVRELSVVVPLQSGLDAEVGRFQVGWGETDGYSPADAFLPRDLSGPLPEEPLPLWGARVRGERGRLRFELFAAPTTTPWRLPALDGRQSPLSSVGVFFVEEPVSVPHAGFEAARVTGTVDGWDVGGWVRTGVRPAPVLVPMIDEAEETNTGVLVPLAQHFAHESAVGTQLSRAYGEWVVRGELSVFHSKDPSLGDAVIWTVGGSRSAGDGTLTATVAGNAIAPPVNPLLVLDRALLPAAIVAFREPVPWGSWRVAWLGTFQTVGGVLSAEMTRDLTDVVKVTAGADLPHGAPLSPASAFFGGKRVRAALRWSW